MSLKPCGTTAAYFRHIRAGETACDPCRKAMTLQRSRYPKSKRERAWKVRDEILDWLHLDGGWLTAAGLAVEIGRAAGSVERELRSLRRDGMVESRVVELALSSVSRSRVDSRTEWRVA